MAASALLPFAAALMAWFFATGAILWLDRRPEDSWGASLLGATVVAGFAFAAVLVSQESATPLAAYTGFLAAILLWGWHELSFLLGFVTGPRREACPPDVRGWQRFRPTKDANHSPNAVNALPAPLLVLVNEFLPLFDS